MIGDSNDEINLPHKLLLTDRQISKPLNSSANLLLTKIQLSKIL